MRRTMLALVALAAIALALTMSASLTSAQDPAAAPAPATTPAPTPAKPAPLTYWQARGCRTFVAQARYGKRLRKVVRYRIINGDFRAAPVKRQGVRQLAKMRRCARSAKAKRNMVRATKRHRKTYRWVAYIDRITPYGKFAVPTAIVNCEGGYNGWGVYNTSGSGAGGPYQLMAMHGRIMPATTPAAQAQHHEIAARLVAEGGFGPWVSSRHCHGY